MQICLVHEVNAAMATMQAHRLRHTIQMMDFFCPTLEHFCPLFAQIAQMGSLFASVQGYSDSVTHCQQGLNLKVGKKRPHLGTPDPIWAKG